MATTGAKGPLGTTNVPAGTSLVPLEARRKFSLSDKYIFKDFSDVRLLSLLTKRMQRSPVDDPKFKIFEDGYPRLAGTISGCDAAGTSAALAVGTVYLDIPYASEFLQNGDVIHVPRDQTNQTSTTAYLFGENMEIVIIYHGATSATDYVKVIRNIGQSATTYNVTAGSGKTLNFYTVSNANREGGASPEAFTNAMEEIYQYTQIFKKTVDITGTRQATRMWGPQDELAYQRKKKRKEILREIERACFIGQRDNRNEDGKAKRYMGGLNWWLGNGSGDYTSWSTTNDLNAGNGTSRIWRVTDTTDVSKWSSMLFFKFIQHVMEYGNKQAKVGFCGDGFVYHFNKMFENKIRLENDPDFFGLAVMKYHSPSGTLTLLGHPELTQSGYTNACFIADLDYVGYRYLSANGKIRDLKLVKNVQNNDVDGQKDEWRAEIGLDMRFWEAHSACVIYE